MAIEERVIYTKNIKNKQKETPHLISKRQNCLATAS